MYATAPLLFRASTMNVYEPGWLGVPPIRPFVNAKPGGSVPLTTLQVVPAVYVKVTW